MLDGVSDRGKQTVRQRARRKRVNDIGAEFIYQSTNFYYRRQADAAAQRKEFYETAIISVNFEHLR